MVAHGVKVVRVVGDGVAVVVCPDSVRGMVAHGVELPGSLVMVWRSLRTLMSFGVVDHDARLHRSGRGRGGRCGVSAHSLEVAQIASEGAPGLSRCKIQYIYNVLGVIKQK